MPRLPSSVEQDWQQKGQEEEERHEQSLLHVAFLQWCKTQQQEEQHEGIIGDSAGLGQQRRILSAAAKTATTTTTTTAKTTTIAIRLSFALALRDALHRSPGAATSAHFLYPGLLRHLQRRARDEALARLPWQDLVRGQPARRDARREGPGCY
mgnify:CR=1 FL=1